MNQNKIPFKKSILYIALRKRNLKEKPCDPKSYMKTPNMSGSKHNMIFTCWTFRNSACPSKIIWNHCIILNWCVCVTFNTFTFKSYIHDIIFVKLDFDLIGKKYKSRCMWGYNLTNRVSLESENWNIAIFHHSIFFIALLFFWCFEKWP